MSPSRPKLYNPKLVCACALLFTPIFGALLQARNWEEMGIPENARASRVWVRSTVWLIVVYLVLQALFRNEEIANWLGPYFLIVLWGSWMLTNGWRQLAFVNQTYGKNYDSLPIGRPMILGAAGWLFYGLISFTMALGLSLAGIEPLNQSAPENGVVIRIQRVLTNLLSNRFRLRTTRKQRQRRSTKTQRRLRQPLRRQRIRRTRLTLNA